MFSSFRIVIIFLFVCLASLLVIPHLRVELVPQETAARLTVTYTFPNTSPEVVEQQATAPLENVLSQLAHLRKIESRSSYNHGQITLTFDKQADMGMKKFETTSIIRQVYPQLGEGISYPVVVQHSGTETREKSPLLVYTVTGPASAYEVKCQAEESLRKPLALINGLHDLRFSGSENLQVVVEYDQRKATAFGVDMKTIPSLIQSQWQTTYPGDVVSYGHEYFVKIRGTEQNLASLEEMVIPQTLPPSAVSVKEHQPALHSRVVRLKDIARVFVEEAEPQHFFRINSKNAITLSLYAREGENAILLADEIKTTIEKTALTLPPGYETRLDYDNTEYIRKELRKNYLRTSLSVFILILLITLYYRSWRYLLTLVMSLVVNVSLTILLAWYFTINIHLYTLAGVAISFGIMIDNAIVMVDYYHQHRNRKVFLALLGATLTTIAALLLVFLLPEEDRKNLTDFVSIMALALSASLLSSLFFTPGLYDLLFTKRKQERIPAVKHNHRKSMLRVINSYTLGIGFIARFRKTFIALLVLLFGIPVFMLPSKWEGHEWYNRTLGSDMYQEKIRPHSDKLLGGALRLFVRNVFEKSSYRDASRTKLYINAELPHGNTLAQMDFIIRKMEEYLAGVNGVDKYVTQVRSGQYASIEITFKKEHENTSLPFQLKARLIARSLDWGGVSWHVYGVGQGFSNASGEEIPSFHVKMKGYNFDELERQANVLAGKLLEHQRIQLVNVDERLSYFEKSSREYVLSLDPYRLSTYNETPTSVIQHLQSISKPTGASAFVTLEHTLTPLIISVPEASDFSTWQMMEAPLLFSGGNTIRLKEAATLDLQRTSGTIHKEDRQYIRMVGFDYYGSHHFGNRYLDEKINELKNKMPIGYTAEKQSWQWDFSRVKRQYALIALLLLANFIICSILLENLRQPLFIIATIPISFVGLFLIFALFDFYFDQGGYAAFVLLGGLVVNASIFIVNDFNNRRYRIKKHNQALIKTVINRGRTIVLTILTTCCGVIPFLLEGQKEVFWFSLAIGTIGGLLMSLFAVFVVLPVLIWRRELV